MKLEEAIVIAKKYYENKDMPKNTTKWRYDCPSDLTLSKISRMDFTVGQLLEAINPGSVRQRRSNVYYDVDKLGFISLEFNRDIGTYVCANCSETRTSNRSSILIWLTKGIKHCSNCRGVSGLRKDSEYYSKKIPEDFIALEVLREAGNTKVLIQHKPCKATKIYSSKHIMSSDYLVCKSCSDSEGFDSVVEKEVCTYLLENYPKLKLQFQVKYSNIIPTERRWVADVYVEELSLVLEITTKGNGFKGYFENLTDKQDALKEHGVISHVIYSKHQVDDIVRPLLKGREC